VTDPPFTPGPWHSEQGQKPPHHLLVIGPRGQGIACVFKRSLTDDPQCFADTALMVQAPALFDALRDVVLSYRSYRRNNGDDETSDSIELAEEILDRCEGKR